MVDGGEADDKIIAVLEGDPIWGEVKDITDIPKSLIERLRHYFLTYKLRANTPLTVDIKCVFGVLHAKKVIEAAMQDYLYEYGE